MDKELSQYLTKRYPKIFTSKRVIEDFTWGFECDSGWFRLLDSTCSNLQHHIDHSQRNFEKNMLYKSYIDNNELDKLPPYINVKSPDLDLKEPCSQVIATQIKEKFGTLRFYYNGGDDFCYGVVNLAQSMSSCICEVCGDEGKLRMSGWLKVLCDKHVKENDKVMEENLKGYLNILMGDDITKVKITHQLSDDEALCETTEGVKIHAIKIKHPKITYWYGKALE